MLGKTSVALSCQEPKVAPSTPVPAANPHWIHQPIPLSLLITFDVLAGILIVLNSQVSAVSILSNNTPNILRNGDNKQTAS